MIKKILKWCGVLLVGYFMLIFNAYIIAFIYIKFNPMYKDNKVLFPFGLLSLILTATELFLYFKIKNLRRKKV